MRIFGKFLLCQKARRPKQEFLAGKERNDSANDLADCEQALQPKTYLKREVYPLLASDILNLRHIFDGQLRRQSLRVRLRS